MLSPSGEYVVRPLPPKFLPPPALDAEIENTARDQVQHQTAAEAGYIDERAPCNREGRLFNKLAARKCLFLYHFMNLSIDESHVRAVTPANCHEDLAGFIITCKGDATKLTSATYSILGEETSELWFSRLVLGNIELHDAKVFLWNTQCDILANRFAYPEEVNDDDLATYRTGILVALIATFWKRLYQLIKLYDETIALAEHRSGNKKEHKLWLASRGMYDDPEYIEELRQERDKLANKRVWDPVENRSDVPQKRRTYAEKFPLDGKNFPAFWEPIFSKPGFLKSMFKAYNEVLWLEGCINNDKCREFMMMLASNAAHYTWLRHAWKKEENTVLAKMNVRTAYGQLVKLKFDSKDSFNYLRNLIAEHSELTYDDVIVRKYIAPVSAKRKAVNEGTKTFGLAVKVAKKGTFTRRQH